MRKEIMRYIRNLVFLINTDEYACEAFLWILSNNDDYYNSIEEFIDTVSGLRDVNINIPELEYRNYLIISSIENEEYTTAIDFALGFFESHNLLLDEREREAQERYDSRT